MIPEARVTKKGNILRCGGKEITSDMDVSLNTTAHVIFEFN